MTDQDWISLDIPRGIKRVKEFCPAIKDDTIAHAIFYYIDCLAREALQIEEYKCVFTDEFGKEIKYSKTEKNS